MGKGRTTGDGDEYNHADEDAMEAACDEGWDEWDDEEEAESAGSGGIGGAGGGGSGGDDGHSSDGPGGGGGRRRGTGRDLPTAMEVRAEIEWAGENRGVRTTRLQGVHTAELRRATDRARAARAKASAARPAASYRATGWTARLRQLETTKRGRDALARAGFDAAARTRRRWRAGTGGASPARQRQIAAAYEDMRMRPVRDALELSRAASKDLSTTMTETLRDAYSGTTIRLHNIESVTFRRR